MKNPRDGMRVVAIGGGTGLPILLAGLKRFLGGRLGELTAIVTVTDDGGSSGRLRDELQILPPGDTWRPSSRTGGRGSSKAL